MITLNKWYPLVQPTHTARELAFDKAVEKVQEEYRYAIECLKQVRKTEDLELELYDKVQVLRILAKASGLLDTPDDGQRPSVIGVNIQAPEDVDIKSEEPINS
jgi:hypothetical protein